MDAREKFKIWTDHKNLTYFQSPQRLNARQARWYLTLQEYDFELKHIPGKQNNKADILSWLPWYKEALPEQKDLTMLKDKHFIKKTMSLVTDQPLVLFMEEQFFRGGKNIKSSKRCNKRWIKLVQVKSNLEEDIKTAMTQDKLDDFCQIDSDHLEYKDGMMHFKNKVYIPPSLREKVMKENHDTPIAGHPGISKSQELIKRNYWWPKMNQDIEQYVKGCDACQRNKSSRQLKATELKPHEMPTTPWESISVDLIGPIPESKGFNAILAVIDQFSKMIRLILTTMELTLGHLAEIYRDQIWKLHSILKTITSDHGPQFRSQFIKNFVLSWE